MEPIKVSEVDTLNGDYYACAYILRFLINGNWQTVTLPQFKAMPNLGKVYDLSSAVFTKTGIEEYRRWV